VDLLTTQDDLGRAAIVLTGTCVLLGLVVSLVCAPRHSYRLQRVQQILIAHPMW